jgi:hypothetical protein
VTCRNQGERCACRISRDLLLGVRRFQEGAKFSGTTSRLLAIAPSRLLLNSKLPYKQAVAGSSPALPTISANKTAAIWQIGTWFQFRREFGITSRSPAA